MNDMFREPEQSKRVFPPNDSCEAYTENRVDRKGNRTSLKQFSLVTSIKAVGQGVILSETNTKEPSCEALEEPSGSKSVVCAERNVGNLGDPLSSCRDRKERPTKRRSSGYSWGVRSSIVLGGGRADHMGKEATVLRSPQRKHGPDKLIRNFMPTSLRGIATGHPMSPLI